MCLFSSWRFLPLRCQLALGWQIHQHSFLLSPGWSHYTQTHRTGEEPCSPSLGHDLQAWLQNSQWPLQRCSSPAQRLVLNSQQELVQSPVPELSIPLFCGRRYTLLLDGLRSGSCSKTTGSTGGSGSAGHCSELLSPSEEFPAWVELPSPAPGGESSPKGSQSTEMFLLWAFKLETGLLTVTLDLLQAPTVPVTWCEAGVTVAIKKKKKKKRTCKKKCYINK